MPFIEAPTTFYLGREFVPGTQQLDNNDVVYYDSRDLTTHAVVVGMTGSGKTGLCITLLEEAILDNIPSIIIDPKGDITNLLLTFPELRPEDFAPWIHEDDARRAGLDKASYSADVAQQWRDGLRSWGIVPERVRWLNIAAQYSIFTPGSDAGLPISILSSLRAPREGWNGREEQHRERINGIVTALLALAGLSVEPVKDKEHVLVANIFEYAWSRGQDLTLEDIILQVQRPQFEKLGVFPVDEYISEKNRFKLAMDLNNVIAAPSFQSWLYGQPMDIQSLLYQPNGRPRVSVFYTAHLSEAERMFITTLILENMLAWMRTQSGTSSLRALLYVDEMFGYFPPYPKNPPTKDPIMRLLKQARAFGVGMILATQNPGDLDYKGLTNAGTWFIGRLQSENDKKKVMAGLQSLATADAGRDLADVEQLISDIQPRVFLMRNVHDTSGPILVHTRWAMSFLAGPMTREQIRRLMETQKQVLIQQVYAPPPQPQMQQTFAPPPPQSLPGQPGFTQRGYPAPPQSLPGQQPGYPQPGGYAQPNAFAAQVGGGYVSDYTQPTGATSPVDPVSSGRAPAGYKDKAPAVASAINQYFLPNTLTVQQAMSQWTQSTGFRTQGTQATLLAYQPVLLAQAAVRYQDRKANIYTDRTYAFHVPDLQPTGLINWEEYQTYPVDRRNVSSQPSAAGAIFGELPVGLTDVKRLKTLEGELIDMIYNTARLILPYNPSLKTYGNPDADPGEFHAQAMQIAREQRDIEIDKVSEKYAKMMDKLEDQLRRKERELSAEQKEIRDRKREELFTTGEAIFSLFKGRTNYTLSRMSRATRYKRQTQEDIQETKDVLDELDQQMYDLEQEYEAELAKINDKWGAIATDAQEYTITPFKKDVHIDLFGIGWLPHWYINVNGQVALVPAFG